MPARQIFISHSTKGAGGVAVLEQVAAGLQRAGYVPLYDKQNLEPSDDWYQRISEFMVVCDGAVFLVDQGATASDYVRHEASVLSNRCVRSGRHSASS